MNTASLELSKELYELSGWDSDYYYQNGNKGEDQLIWRQGEVMDNHHRSEFIYYSPEEDDIPAYTLGYLLRKLPEGTRLIRNKSNPRKRSNYRGEWAVGVYGEFKPFSEDGSVISSAQHGDTPEDAVCKLAIELFKQGILKK